MLFSTLFQLYHGSHCTNPGFLGVLSTTPHNILSKQLAAFPHNVHQINRGERGMNPVAMTIINPLKEYCPSWRFEPVTLCSQAFYATDCELRGLGIN